MVGTGVALGLPSRCSPRSTSARSSLQTFGIAFALSFVASGLTMARRLQEIGKPVDWVYEMVFAALIGGLIGSRIDYLIQNWDKVSDDLLGNIFSGSGLVFFGGLFGGAIGVIIWALRRGVLGLGAGRLGAPCRSRSGTSWAESAASCPATGTTARASDLPWAMAYPDGTVPTTEEVHPTPVYETLAMGFATLVLWHLRDRFARGVLFGIYLVIVGGGAVPGRDDPAQRLGGGRA